MSIAEEIIINKNVGDKVDTIDYMQSQNNKSRSDSIITELLEPNQIETTLTQNNTIKRSGYYIVYPFSDYGKAEHVLGEITSESWRATRVDGMIYYDDGTAMGDRMFAPGYGGILCLRSVVRLKSTTKLQKSTDASNAGGTPHKILEYQINYKIRDLRVFFLQLKVFRKLYLHNLFDNIYIFIYNKDTYI